MQPNTFIFSQQLCRQICAQIVTQAEGLLAERNLVRNNLLPYSSNRLISVTNQLGEQLLSLPFARQNTYTEEQEPVNIGLDTMTPSINNVEVRQLCLNSNHSNEDGVSHLSRKTSLVSNLRKQKKPSLSQADKEQQVRKEKQSQNTNSNKTNTLLQLQSLKEKEDPVIDGLREETIRQRREAEEKLNKGIVKKTSIKAETISYDYDGNHLNMKPEKRKNLVSKIVEGKIQQQEVKKMDRQNYKREAEAVAKRLKEKTINLEVKPIVDAKNDKPRTKAHSFANKKPEKQVEVKCLDAVCFSQIDNPLSNLEVKLGVKATFERNVHELKQKEQSVKDLRKSITSRKISKEEYSKLKESTVRDHNMRNDIDKKINDSEKKQTIENGDYEVVKIDEYLRAGKTATGQRNNKKSEAIKPSSAMRRSVTETQEEKIKLGDPNLINIMLNKMQNPQMVNAHNPIPIVNVNADEKAEKQISHNRIDKFNLDYSRRRVESSNAAKRPESRGMQLPKIQQKSSLQIPKNRERVKDGSQMRRTTERKFEDILRV